MKVRVRDKKIQHFEDEYQNVSIDALHEKVSYLESRLEMARHKIETLEFEKQKMEKAYKQNVRKFIKNGKRYARQGTDLGRDLFAGAKEFLHL